MHNERNSEFENSARNSDKEATEQVNELEDLSIKLVEAKEQAAENLANWQRAQADFINFKRRLEQDRDEAVKYADMGLILNLLPVLDDFERALNAASQADCDTAWIEGVNGIERKFRAVLEMRGVKEIKALAKQFDPIFHEAVMHIPGKEGVVIRELQKGYTFQDRVLRPTRVAVGNGEVEKSEHTDV